MPWVKFSDDWYDDSKLAGASPAVLATWAVGISWCARNLTDGVIPRGEHRRLVNLYDTFDSEGQQVHPDRVADELVERGAWQETAGAYVVTNYHRYQPTREKVLADRDAAKDRAAKSRDRAREVPANFDERADPPVPVPVPDNPSSSSSQSDSRLPADLWKKVAQKQAGNVTTPIRDLQRWTDKAASNARKALESRALSLVEHYDLTTSQLVDVLVEPSNPPWIAHHRRKESA